MEIRIILMALSLSFTVFPAMAAEDEMNSGFGKDYFAGDPHPAFEDPSFFDIDSLTGIEPSAGGDEELRIEESQPAVTESSAVPSLEENRATGASEQ